MQQPITMTPEEIRNHQCFTCPLCFHVLHTTGWADPPAGFDAWECSNCEQIVFTPEDSTP